MTQVFISASDGFTNIPTHEAILFDLDDTLINHTLAEERGARLFFERHAINLCAETVEEFLVDWRNASNRHMKQFLDGDISFAEQRRRRCREVTRQEATHKEADLLFDDYLEAYELNWKTFDDVPAVLETLRTRGICMGIISNGNIEQQMKKLNKTNLLQYFERVVISEAVGTAKPDKMIFQIAASQIGCRIQRCTYVGDSFETDVRGASAAGMRPVWINRQRRKLSVSNMDHILQIFDLNELHNLI